MMAVNKKMVATNVLILLTVVLLGVSCFSKPPAGWGKLLKHKGGSLFYTSNVTEEEARRLVGYLLKTKFFQDDKSRIAQLTKKGNVYQVRVVADKGVIEQKRTPEEMGPVEAAGLLARDISEKAFNGAKVEWHLCDDKLNTLRVGTY